MYQWVQSVALVNARVHGPGARLPDVAVYRQLSQKG